MSIKSKIAAIAAASIGMVLTQSSAPRAEAEDNSAPEKVTTFAAPLDVDEEIFYSPLPDEALEKAAGFGETVHFAANPYSQAYPTQCLVGGGCSDPRSAKKPTLGGLKYEDRKVPPRQTVAPKSTQGTKNK
jgi:hypothetical protein